MKMVLYLMYITFDTGERGLSPFRLDISSVRSLLLESFPVKNQPNNNNKKH